MRRATKPTSAASTSGSGIRRGLFAISCLCVLGLAAFLGSAAPSVAAAAEPCPNQQVRQQQHSTYLPDCRAYELVSPEAKNTGRVGSAAISTDGTRVQFAIAQGPSTGTAALFVSEPNASGAGWTAHSMMPPADQLLLGGSYSILTQTPSLSTFFANVHPGVFGEFPITLLQLDGNGGQREVITLPPGNDLLSARPVVSADGAHLYSNDRTPLDPGDVPGTYNVYDLAANPPVLASRLPDGTVPACGVQGTGANPGFSDTSLNSSNVEHWASEDGSRVFFLTPGNVCDGSVPTQLYMRDTVAGTTTLISAPALAGPDANARFLGATPDGSQVTYVTAAQLTADDTNSDPDIYRYTAGPGGGSQCLTCLVSDANVKVFGGGTIAGVSEDLSHVYFTSEKQLIAGKGTEGASNLYVWHKDPATGTPRIDWISPGAFPFLFNNAAASGQLTPDGNVAVFTANDPGMDALTPGRTNGGFLQLYRYDDRPADATAGVTCISCPPDGSAPASDVITPLINTPDARIMSDDGNTLFFRTSDALLPQDVNGTTDLYEWRDGQVSLISDGVTPQKLSNADQLMGASASGNDVFFLSFSHLTGDRLDTSNQLYDAKVNGGQLITSTPPCQAEACQGDPSPQPAAATPASSTFTGPANRRPRHKGRKHHKHHKKHVKTHHSHRPS